MDVEDTTLTPNDHGSIQSDQEIQDTTNLVTLTYVLEKLCGISKDDHPIKLAFDLNFITSMEDWMSLDDNDIKLMEFVDPNDSKHRRKLILPLGIRNLVIMIKKFGIHKAIQLSRPLTNGDWGSFSITEFNSFRLNPQPIIPPPITSTATATPLRSNIGSPLSLSSPVSQATKAKDDFRKTIKREKTHYPMLKHEKHWHTWYQGFIIQAKAHGMDHIIDFTYVPNTAEEKALFEEEQKFMVSVFHHVVHTDKGKDIIYNYLEDNDAQSIFHDLCEHHRTSTSAQMHATDLLRYLTSTKYDKLWTTGTHAFVLHWLHQARLYNRQVDKGNRLPDALLVNLLQVAVFSVDDLRQVQTVAELTTAGGGSAIVTTNLERYKNLLLSAATRYDAKHSKRTNGTRQVVYTDTSNDDDNTTFDIDTPIDDIREINMAKSGYTKNPNFNPARRSDNNLSGKPSSSNNFVLSKDDYLSLNEEQRAKWRDFRASLKDDPKLMRKVNLLDSAFDASTDDDTEQTPSQTNEETSVEKNPLLAYVAGRKDASDGDLRAIMSTSLQRNVNVIYTVSKHKTKRKGTLCDRGATGGVIGEDLRILEYTDATVSVVGVDHHEVPHLKLATAAGLVQTQKGPVIAIMHQYAVLGRGKTIHSSIQLEAFKNDVCDKSTHTGGKQRIITPDGYIIPIHIRNGLPEIDMRSPTDTELDKFPHVMLTSDEHWNPGVLDHEIDIEDETWFDTIQGDLDDDFDPTFDDCGVLNRSVNHIDAGSLDFYSIFDSSSASEKFWNDIAIEVNHLETHTEYHVHVNDSLEASGSPTIEAQSPETINDDPDWERLRPCFGWESVANIKKTFKATTQYAKSLFTGNFRRHYKTRYPACNVFRRPEAVATDYIDVGIEAVDNGSTGAQIFSGVESRVVSAYGVKSDGEFVETLEDEIRKRGAMDMLVSDCAKAEISKKAKNILRAYRINDFQSEPHHQNQNPAERQIQRVKHISNRVLDRTGAPAFLWLLCLQYVCLLCNLMALDSLNGRTPMEYLTGVTQDISALMNFSFYQPVYFATHQTPTPDESGERLGYWVGVADNVGDALTYKIFDPLTEKIVFRSDIRPCDDHNPNLRVSPEKGGIATSKKPILRSRHDSSTETNPPSPVFDVDDLLGRTFLLPANEETGERYRAKVKRPITLHGDDKPNDIGHMEFIVETQGTGQDQILTYNEIIDYVNKQSLEPTDLANPDAIFTFRNIKAHQGPLHPSDPNYKGSMWNVMVEWETGEVTNEPLSLIASDDPVTCAQYALKHGLLNKRGWKQLKRIAKREKVMKRLINQTKIKQFRRSPKYKFGVQIPYDYQEAMKLDKENGNTKWADATQLEITLLDSYTVFRTGPKARFHNRKLANHPEGYTMIRGRMVYDVKHDGRHRARYVAGGHLTDIPIESCYSSVVSMQDVRLVVFLAELNQLELWGADISSAYLLAETKEKVFIIGGPEFGDRCGFILFIFKAQYGLRTSGVRWHDKLFDILVDIGFQPSYIPDVYMRKNKRKNGTYIWEYVATYVDDLLLAMDNPEDLLNRIRGEPWNFKIKGDKLDYHLGCNFVRDKDNVLMWKSTKYTERLMSTYERLFGEAPNMSKKYCTAPLPHGDHPEIDETDLCSPEDIKKYMSLIGCLQWLVTLGRLDIMTSVMTMSRFTIAPRIGHLDRLKRIVNYIRHTKDAAIRVRTHLPDYSAIPDLQYDWEHTPYKGSKEEIPPKCPEPLGKSVITTHYIDANLEHDKITGKAVTGNLSFVNGTPVDWYSKRQSTCETATYGSELVAARIAGDKIIDLRTRLRYLGVPIEGPSYLFGDNKAVTMAAAPHGTLSKRHHALNYHRVRESIAAGIFKFLHIDGKKNPADILSKHCGWTDAFPHLQPLLFWAGDTKFCRPPDHNQEMGSDKNGTGKGSSLGEVPTYNQDEDSQDVKDSQKKDKQDCTIMETGTV